jgi:hypothetical protein
MASSTITKKNDESKFRSQLLGKKDGALPISERAAGHQQHLIMNGCIFE